jgi:fermentation-respiration switch protein FrsA (DUF1100 family)
MVRALILDCQARSDGVLRISLVGGDVYPVRTFGFVVYWIGVGKVPGKGLGKVPGIGVRIVSERFSEKPSDRFLERLSKLKIKGTFLQLS